MKIDMHFHSTHSDGYSTQEELIEEAQKKISLHKKEVSKLKPLFYYFLSK